MQTGRLNVAERESSESLFKTPRSQVMGREVLPNPEDSKVSELAQKCFPYECVCSDYDQAAVATCCLGASACVCCVLLGTDYGSYLLKTIFSM